MPNIKSAKKRIKTSEKQRVANRETKSKINTIRTKFNKVLASGDKDGATKVFGELCSVLDRAAKKGVIKTNAASRRKSRASRKIAAL